jgi:hypothetical protein
VGEKVNPKKKSGQQATKKVILMYREYGKITQNKDKKY